jgi:gamma-glutamyltranspeptidase/glutathione hydrolase
MSGAKSVSVPGMVGGWCALAERFGRLPLPRLMQTAIRHADEGFPVYPGLLKAIRERKDSVASDANCRALFLPGGEPPREGERLRQPALAVTLDAIARGGSDAFYRGAPAQTIAGYVQSRGGVLSAQDLHGFEPLWQQPIEAPFLDTQVFTMPPNSWAAALPLQLLKLQEEGIAVDDELAFVLQGIRSRQWAYALLQGCVADPAFVGERARELVRAAVSGQAPRATTAQPAASAGGTNTNNVVAVDAQGNAVSLLQSLFVPFGSALLDPASGALMNNRIGGFSASAGDPNCIGPAKRPAQTLTPALVRDRHGVRLACCTPGGPGQTACMAQFIARVLARGEPLATAIAAARWSITLTGKLILEDNALPAVCAEVMQQMPEVEPAAWGSVNFGSMIAILRDGDTWTGCADARKDAAAMAV